MSKVIKAINAMVSHENQIGPVLRGDEGGELFFMYGGKHKWSIIRNQKNEYYLHYYPGGQDIKQLASWPEEAWHDFSEMVSYNTRDLGTKEAYDSLSELYTIVQEKLFGMDKVLDEIIGDDFPF